MASSDPGTPPAESSATPPNWLHAIPVEDLPFARPTPILPTEPGQPPVALKRHAQTWENIEAASVCYTWDPKRGVGLTTRVDLAAGNILLGYDVQAALAKGNLCVYPNAGAIPGDGANYAVQAFKGQILAPGLQGWSKFLAIFAANEGIKVNAVISICSETDKDFLTLTAAYDLKRGTPIAVFYGNKWGGSCEKRSWYAFARESNIAQLSQSNGLALAALHRRNPFYGGCTGSTGSPVCNYCTFRKTLKNQTVLKQICGACANPGSKKKHAEFCSKRRKLK